VSRNGWRAGGKLDVRASALRLFSRSNGAVRPPSPGSLLFRRNIHQLVERKPARAFATAGLSDQA
jgi:hypothetical protein